MSDGWLPEPAGALFGDEAEAHESYEVLTVDVPPGSWTEALTVARDRLGCTFFDWLSAVDEPGVGFRVCAHVVALGPVRRLLLRTTVPHDAPALATAVDVYAGAAWHERETHEMFGVRFEGHPGLEPLLLPEGFEGHPLRKDFVLAARVAKAWPGAKEPGESDHGGPKRRQMLPPGVPDPNEWGPLKGTLPAAPARGAARAAGADRPRRTRTASAGPGGPTAPAAAGPTAPTGPTGPTASTAPTGPAATAAEGPEAPAAPAAPRRSRSVSQGSASQREEARRREPQPGEPQREEPQPGEPGGVTEASATRPAPSAGGPRRSRSVSEGSASQRQEPQPEESQREEPRREESRTGEPRREEPRREEPAAREPRPEERGGSGEGSATPSGPRRARRASGGSASQRDEAAGAVPPGEPGGAEGAPPAGLRRARSASGGSASQRAKGETPDQEPPRRPRTAPRSPDAPWHHAKPAFEEPDGPRESGDDDGKTDDDRKTDDPEGGGQ